MRDSHRIGFCRVAVAQRVRERGIRCMDKGYSHYFFFRSSLACPQPPPLRPPPPLGYRKKYDRRYRHGDLV